MPTGTDRVAAALGMSTPRPRLRVIRGSDPVPSDDTPDHGVWRPSDLSEFVGQTRAQLQLRMWVGDALDAGRQPGHILLSGPPGLGKTSMAALIAALINERLPKDKHVKLIKVTGATVNHIRLLAKELNKISAGDVLMIDEGHEMGLKVQEMLGIAMEDGEISVPGTTSGTVDSAPITIPPFTVAIATTKPGHLSRPLRDRIGMELALEYYSEDELAELVRNAARREDIPLTADAADAIALVSRQTPRVALNILTKVGVYARTLRLSKVDGETALQAFEVWGLDSLGLTETDRFYLETIHAWAGRRVGLAPLVSRTGLDARHITDAIEPDLLRMGLLDSNSRGRCLTRAAYRHLWPDKPIPPLLGLS